MTISVGEIRARHRIPGIGLTDDNYGGNDVSGFRPLRVRAIPRRVARDTVLPGGRELQWWAERSASSAWYLNECGFMVLSWDGSSSYEGR